MYVHSFIAFNPCMCVYTLYTCQSSTEALCGFDNNLNISCHNSHRLYWHVYTCQHQLQPKSIPFVYKLCLCTFTPKSNHLWTCTYMSAFVPSTFQLMHGYTSIVNTALSTITSMCAYMSASTQVIIMCVHRQQPVCLSTFTTKSLSCVHVYTYVHSFIAFDPCMCARQSSTQALCCVDVTSILSVTSPVLACIYMLASASTQAKIFRVQALCLCTYTPKSNHLWTCTYMSAFVPSTLQLMHGYMSIVNTVPCRQ